MNISTNCLLPLFSSQWAFSYQYITVLNKILWVPTKQKPDVKKKEKKKKKERYLTELMNRNYYNWGWKSGTTKLPRNKAIHPPWDHTVSVCLWQRVYSALHTRVPSARICITTGKHGCPSYSFTHLSRRQAQ